MSPARVPIKNHPRGFTLIELLVVVFIIGILIAATLTIIPKVRLAVQGAQTSAQLAAIATAIQQYYNDFKAYPGPLANSQLYTAADANTTANEPQIGGNILTGVSAVPATDTTNASAPYMDASGSKLDPTHITGAENLVLGLCGGLRLDTTRNPNVFEYDPGDLFAVTMGGSSSAPTASVAPSPKGAQSLNPSNPRRQQAYLNVSPGDMSVPNFNTNMGQFTDSASRHSADSIIPEFVAKFGEPLPILYFRTNTGGTAIAGSRSTSQGANSTPLVQYFDDSGKVIADANGNAMVPQYDLDENIAYTGYIGKAGPPVTSTIGLRANNPNSIHGLQALAANSAEASGSAPLTDPIDTNVGGTYVPCGPASPNALLPGANALAYFKDPSLNTAGTSTNTYQGVARQKDGFVLISAGPDRQYGTRDDIIYPGPLQP
jgi:prepilin-type N-terminal cleavage/methylation domain-containing protein